MMYLAIVVVSAITVAFGVLSITNLTAITLISNIGTFVFFGMTNLVALVAFWSNPQRKVLVLTFWFPSSASLANISMLIAILYLGILGGGDTQDGCHDRNRYHGGMDRTWCGLPAHTEQQDTKKNHCKTTCYSRVIPGRRVQDNS